MNANEIKAICEGVATTFSERARYGTTPDIKDVLNAIEYELVVHGHMKMHGDRSTVRFEYNDYFGDGDMIGEVDDSMDIWQAYQFQAENGGKVVN